jgi:serine/threonine-protein kinase
MLQLDPNGTLGPGVSLNELVAEPKLPEIRMGPEKYQVLRPLGEGGMGKVYLVYDRDLKRRLALKVSQHSDRAREARFIEEAQVMGQLQHPSIVNRDYAGGPSGSGGGLGFRLARSL